MKRILAFLLCLVMLLPLASCAGEKENETATFVTEETLEKTTAESEKETGGKTHISDNDANVEVGKVVDLGAIDKLNAIPVAKNTMSSDELRQICVDFFKLQLSFRWTPSESLEQSDLRVVLQKGTVYGGIPYTSKGAGNLYRALDHYDPETGVIDLSTVKYDIDNFVNACSGSAIWAWQRVVNSCDIAWTTDFTTKRGCVLVGPYKCSQDVDIFDPARASSDTKYNQEEVVKENGEQIMYQSYAQMKPADGLSHPGHIRMNSAVPTVVYKADGTIDGDQSYTYYCDQQLYVIPDYQSDGSEVVRQGGVDVKVTFKELYDKYYIPVSFKEFHGLDPVEDGSVTLSSEDGVAYTSSSTTAKDLATMVVKSNYVISDVYVRVLDANGAVKYERKYMPDNHVTNSVNLQRNTLVSSAIKKINSMADGTTTIEVAARISNGETLVAYSGVLVAAN